MLDGKEHGRAPERCVSALRPRDDARPAEVRPGDADLRHLRTGLRDRPGFGGPIGERMGRDSAERPVGLARLASLRGAPCRAEGILHRARAAMEELSRFGASSGSRARLPGRAAARPLRRVQPRAGRARADALAGGAGLLLRVRHRPPRRVRNASRCARLRDVQSAFHEPRPLAFPQAGRGIAGLLRGQVPRGFPRLPQARSTAGLAPGRRQGPARPDRS